MGPGNLPGDLTGSAAKQNESAGGNVAAGAANLPGAGSAARTAEPQAKKRAEFSVRMSSSRGAVLVDPTPAKPDLSARTAADYLPPQLRAQLIAEGKLSAEGVLLPAAAQAEKSVKEILTASPVNYAVTSESDLSRTEQTERPAVNEKGASAFAKLTGLFRRFFGS